MLKIEIRIREQINENWSGWFDGLVISHPDPGETLLSGLVADQSALYGILSRLRDLGLQIALLSSEEVENVIDGRSLR